MDAQIHSIHSAARPRLPIYEPRTNRPAFAVPVAPTPLLTRALSTADWSDAYAVRIPRGAPRRDPQQWAEAIFHSPTPAFRVLYGLREVLVRLVGIEPAGRDVFDTVSWAPDEVLIGADQRHLSFRASVLVEGERVVLTTVVHLHNRRGRVYSAIVRRAHPWVVKRMLVQAARRLAVVPRPLVRRRGRDTITQATSVQTPGSCWIHCGAASAGGRLW